ncbi:GNAT family N-acetyltransferase [Streptomyces sp. WAC 01325]|jgi:[ribosomal protein S18]-alanine N-acetyltransferase|uniref:GNAT family N-acetyltransferase n=2 Tax=Streptomyces TaxID=1883 RepID=UPI000F87BA94|nr:GNAT family N-acetyltransferase [Streptomyces sp. WAC 01325]WSZ69760.1 GNAT family N-acetyltransferase [Streptomyces chartreusis]WTA27258.1 GNAT family N-acetyltransferase [Streptomyces chartreusis]
MAVPEERFPLLGRRADQAFLADSSDRPLTMRGVTDTDLPELLRVDREVFPEDPYPYFVLRQHIDVHGDRILVLDDGEYLHGYVLFVTTSDGYVCWVLSLAVSADQRGRGLGKRLMLEVLRQLRRERVHEVRLTVEPTNAAAITLYRTLGFSTDGGVHRDYLGPGEDRIIMVLGLGSA